MPILPWIKLSWYFCSIWAKLGDVSIDSGNIYVSGYLPLTQKDSVTQMYGLAVYVKEGLSFAWNLSLKNYADSYLFDWLYFTQFSVLLHLSPFLSLCIVFYAIWSNIDQVLSINPSPNAIVFRDFNIHHKDWLICFSGTGRSDDYQMTYSDA